MNQGDGYAGGEVVVLYLKVCFIYKLLVSSTAAISLILCLCQMTGESCLLSMKEKSGCRLKSILVNFRREKLLSLGKCWAKMTCTTLHNFNLKPLFCFTLVCGNLPIGLRGALWILCQVWEKKVKYWMWFVPRTVQSSPICRCLFALVLFVLLYQFSFASIQFIWFINYHSWQFSVQVFLFQLRVVLCLLCIWSVYIFHLLATILTCHCH